jgi:hypothetical protein
MIKRYVMAGKEAGFDWEQEGSIQFTNDPEMTISHLLRDGYQEFFLLEQTMHRVPGNTETSLTEKETAYRHHLETARERMKRMLEDADANGIHVGEFYRLLRDIELCLKK